MVAQFTRLTHKIAIQLRLVAESHTICISRSRRPVRKLLDTRLRYLSKCRCYAQTSDSSITAAIHSEG